MSSIIYNHNVINKKSINKEIKSKTLNSAVLFLNNNTASLPYDKIKDLTLIIQKGMNDNKLTTDIINEQLSSIKEYFNNDENKAKLLIHYIIIMARHASTNTTKINWFFHKDGVNKTSTIDNFLKEIINKKATEEPTQVLAEGLKIIHDIYTNNQNSFNELKLNKFNIGDNILSIDNKGYEVEFVKNDNNKNESFNINQFMSLSYKLLEKNEDEIKDIIFTETILQEGFDISLHYLSKDSKYKICRIDNNVCENGIYAIDIKRMKSLLMWKKTVKFKEVNKELGSGIEGIVYQTTENKAIKKKHPVRSNLLDANKTAKQKQLEKDDKIKDLKEINEHLLTAKFKLSESQIDKYFVFGLHNIKNVDDTKFIMPVINNLQNELNYEQNLILFIQTLKTFNELGYFHPDLANEPFHYSSQNVKIEDNSLPITFDLDSKLEPGLMTSGLPIKDQWLWFYCNINNEFNDKRYILENYYNKNNNKAISDDQDALQEIFLDSLNNLAIKI